MNGNPGPKNKIQPLWRCVIGVITIALALIFYIGWGISKYYFPSQPPSVIDYVSMAVLAYFFLVALTGRWKLAPSHDSEKEK